MFADVRRGLAIAAVVSKATVTDTDGNTIDTSEFFPDRSKSDDDADDAEEADDAAEESTTE
jgi:trigger factor